MAFNLGKCEVCEVRPATGAYSTDLGAAVAAMTPWSARCEDCRPPWATDVHADCKGRITALEAALAREWEYNHSEHCQRTYPHSGICSWPLPDALTPTSAGVAGGAEG